MYKNKMVFLSHMEYREDSDHYLTYKIQRELSKHFDAKSVCYHSHDNYTHKPSSINIRLKYKNKSRISKILNLFYVYKKNIEIIKSHKFDLVWIGTTSSFMNYFIFIYPLFLKNQKFFIQTFTPSVKSSKMKRYLADMFLSFNLFFFHNVGVGSERNVKAYRLKPQQAVMLNIGVHDYGYFERSFNKLRLLYIGTLTNRDIWKSVKGIKIFLNENQECDLEYHIIGTGDQKDISKLIKSIKQNSLETKIKFHGYLPTDEVKVFFERTNVGVSFVPLTEYFQNSSTKTLEYLITGMPVVATNNSFRRNIIDNECGILIDDSPEGFSQGLQLLNNELKSYSSLKIRKKFLKYSLSNTIIESYVPQLQKIIDG